MIAFKRRLILIGILWISGYAGSYAEDLIRVPSLNERQQFMTGAIITEDEYTPLNGEPKVVVDEPSTICKTLNDRCLQWRSAEASLRQAQSAEYNLWISGIQAIVTILALIFTAWAAIAAARAAKAALGALHTERAWMTMNGIELQTHTDLTFDGVVYKNAIAIVTQWRNSGRSPALRLEGFVVHKFFELGDKYPSFDVVRGNEEENSVVTGPNMIFATHPVYVFGENFNKWKDQKIRLAIFVRAEYNDIFSSDTKRYTETCFEALYLGQMIDQSGREIAHISYRLTGSQNSAV